MSLDSEASAAEEEEELISEGDWSEDERPRKRNKPTKEVRVHSISHKPYKPPAVLPPTCSGDDSFSISTFISAPVQQVSHTQKKKTQTVRQMLSAKMKK